MNDKTPQLTVMITSAWAQGFADDDKERYQEWLNDGYHFLQVLPINKVESITTTANTHPKRGQGLTMDWDRAKELSKPKSCHRCAVAREIIDWITCLADKYIYDDDITTEEMEILKKARAWLAEEATDE